MITFDDVRVESNLTYFFVSRVYGVRIMHFLKMANIEFKYVGNSKIFDEVPEDMTIPDVKFIPTSDTLDSKPGLIISHLNPKDLQRKWEEIFDSEDYQDYLESLQPSAESKRIFMEIWNPTLEKIESWAFSSDGVPAQDWELGVIGSISAEQLIKFVINEKCPKRKFFLGCLYVLVGDTISKNYEDELKELSVLLLKSSKINNPIIKRWVERSRKLLLNPETYEYKYWGLDSQYAYQEFRVEW